MSAPALTAESVFLEAANRGLRPDAVQTVSEWADAHRMLSARASAEPSLWRTSRTPYLKEIMDVLSPQESRIQRVVLMKGAQIGGTELGNNWLGYIIHQAPGPVLAVQPTIDMAKRFSKQRLDPMIADTPVLRRLVSERRGGPVRSNLLTKQFGDSGALMLTGANAAASLRSMPIRYLFLDEIDAYPTDVNGEGDPVELAIARTRTFARRKIYMVSTPTRSGSSRIERLYEEESDQRKFFVPCPHCGEMQTLEFAQLRWPKGHPRQARYFCIACDHAIADGMKTRMLAGGQWRVSAEGDGITAGFKISSLYSPVGWFSWADVAQQHEKCGKDEQALQVFFNTVLGESYAESGETPDSHRLYERRESYRIGTVPAGAAALTAGADIQPRRIECEIVAWGPQRESWSVDYRIFEGDTSQPQVWRKLTELLDEDFTTERGLPLRIARMAVDSGFNTLTVYRWAKEMNTPRVMVIKGTTNCASLLGPSSPVEVGPLGRRIRYGTQLWPVNVDLAKQELYRWLRLDAPVEGEAFPPGYCHFPEYAPEYFRQLCAEKMMIRMDRGRPKPYWQQIQERNEALDCRLYARAAALAERIDLWNEAQWQRAFEELTPRNVDEMPKGPPPRKGMSVMPTFHAHAADDPYL